jgi:hypothetical protein
LTTLEQRRLELHEQLANHTESASAPGKRGGVLGRPRVRLSAVIVLAIAAGVVAWVLIGRGSSSSPTTAGPVAQPISPIALSASGLRTLALGASQPIYWAGPKKGYMYELTRTTAGRVFVRYLPAGVKAGAPGANYLIVATYPYPNALNALKAVSHKAQIAVPGGGIAVIDKTYTKSVHVAYPGVAYQVEVYDPSPATARAVAVSGDVRPVG